MKSCFAPYYPVDRQIRGIARELSMGGEGENYPAAVMIMPAVVEFKKFLESRGLDAFLRLSMPWT